MGLAADNGGRLAHGGGAGSRGFDCSRHAMNITLRCHLEFTDWLEALVRLATTIALPTDMELHAAGTSDADEFLMRLRATTPEAYRTFLSDHAQHCERTRAPRQSAGRCLGYLMHLLQARFPCRPEEPVRK